MKIVKEFKEFAMRGNVIDLAVGVIIGGAFGKIVTSLVNDIIMPPVGVLLNGADFKDLYINLEKDKIADDGTVVDSLAKAVEKGEAVIAYGQFINVLLDFLLVALCVFALVKGINMLHRLKLREEADAPAAEPAEKECPYCLSKVPVKATRCAHCTSQLESGRAEGV
ncbi:large-conductance mechanosensitive channel protein MscL [Paenibacillus sp. GCM10023252]|uniref:large-conductance mechanosensitive channel protein MscL n=1 Tax=Paenibacillus sp. GCM10023252 TaxID=3252649 RepID=UPI00360F8C63